MLDPSDSGLINATLLADYVRNSDIYAPQLGNQFESINNNSK
jgi:hypothetical protein